MRYIVERKVGLAEWREVRARLMGLPLEIVPAGQELSELAGELKVTKKCRWRIVWPAVLAKREKAKICTGDHKFKTVEREIKVVWLWE